MRTVNPSKIKPVVMSRKDAMAYMSISRSTLDKMALPKICIFGKVVFRKSDIDEWLDRHTVQPKSEEKADAPVETDEEKINRLLMVDLSPMERVRLKLEMGRPLTDEELKDIISISGLPEGVPEDWDQCYEDPNEQVLEQLANHVHNYLYGQKEGT